LRKTSKTRFANEKLVHDKIAKSPKKHSAQASVW